MASDPNFVSNYYNKKYNIDNAYIKGVPVKEWLSKTQPNLEGNGFTFGHLNSSQSIEVKKLHYIVFHLIIKEEDL